MRFLVPVNRGIISYGIIRCGGYYKLWSLLIEELQVVVAAKMWRILQVVVPVNRGITSCGS